jgi:2-hydroxy-6-oxonona-2,4-dienedioate hydrolase
MSAKVSVRKLIILGSAVVVTVAATWVYSDFQNDISESLIRLEGESKIIETQSGPIEYAEFGEGPVVLVVHGAGGGFDQGLELAEQLISRGYRVIAMSRFGYLRTPMPADASVAAQSKAQLDLLEALNVKTAAVFGVSAGGPSALQFAVSYPDRCSALILMVPLAYKPPEAVAAQSAARPSPLTERLLLMLVSSDFAFWFGIQLAPDLVARTVLGTSPKIIDAASESEKLRAALLAQHILPISHRATGILHDATIADALKRLDLGSVKTPALLISARDDLYGTFAGTAFTAKAIPEAKFIAYETGGHMLIGHYAELRVGIGDFLNANVSH